MAGLFGLIPIYYDLLVERVGNKKDEFGTSYASMPCEIYQPGATSR